MKFRRVLTPKQMKKFKSLCFTFLVVYIVSIMITVVQGAMEDEEEDYYYEEEHYTLVDYAHNPKGYVVEYTNKEEFCRSFVIPSGFTLINEIV